MIMSNSVDFLQRLLENSRVVKMEYDQDVFEVKLDVEKYEPSELSVKVQNEHLIVSGKHEKKSDEFGLVAQQFTRQFLMPEDINLDTLSSTLSSEGILTVRALVKGANNQQNDNFDEDNNVNKAKQKSDEITSGHSNAVGDHGADGGAGTNVNNNKINNNSNDSKRSNDNNNDTKVS